MKTSTAQDRNPRSSLSKILTAAAFGSVIVGISIVPALSQDHERGHEDRDRHERHESYDRHSHRRYGHPAPPPVVYAPPMVYAPPPVIYAPPPPSPGISLIFPIHIR